MRFSTITLGCKVNLYETESLISNLIEHGWEYVKENNDADVYIINTCTVTSTSDQKSRQMIRQARRKNPQCIIVAMGCFVQTHKEDALEIADIVIGTKDKLKVYDLVTQFLEEKERINHVFDIEFFSSYDEMKLERLTMHTRGFVKIQDGCENFCSYCLIPYARGKIKSRHPESVIEEIKKLIQLGTKEIIISGINTGTYGQDLGNITLAKLIERIMEETTLWRLRLSSIELMEVTDELLDVIKRYKNRIANHLHIPLQGGCDGVLKRMKRKYSTDDYANLIDKIRSVCPDIAITTDCLAGFVGETEEEFKETLSFIQRMGFASMHIFPYSRRKGTAADKMEGHLNPLIIKKRAQQMICVAEELKEKYENQFVGRTLDVLIERKKGVYYVGHTSNYLEVYVLSSALNLDNKVIECKINERKQKILYGEIMEVKDE